MSLANVWSKKALDAAAITSSTAAAAAAVGKNDDITMEQRQDEVFKFGMLLLVCAIGSVDLLDESFTAFFEEVRKRAHAVNNREQSQ